MKAKNIVVGNPLGKRIFLPLVLLAFLAIVPTLVTAQESADPAKTGSTDAAKAQVAAAVRVRIERARVSLSGSIEMECERAWSCRAERVEPDSSPYIQVDEQQIDDGDSLEFFRWC